MKQTFFVCRCMAQFLSVNVYWNLMYFSKWIRVVLLSIHELWKAMCIWTLENSFCKLLLMIFFLNLLFSEHFKNKNKSICLLLTKRIFFKIWPALLLKKIHLSVNHFKFFKGKQYFPPQNKGTVTEWITYSQK